MQNKKNLIVVLVILLILMIIGIKKHDLIESKLKYIINQEELPKFEYKYFEKTQEGKYKTLLTFRDINGIDKISYIGEKGEEIIDCNGKIEVALDFAANNYEHYYFTTTSVNGEKNVNNLYLELVEEDYTGPIYQLSNASIIANSNKTPYGTSSPQKLFDGNTSSDYQNYGCYIQHITFPLHINFLLNTPQKVFKMRYFTYANGSYQPIDFTIEGSNDTTNGTDGNWEIIRSYTNLPIMGSNMWGEFFVGSNTAYKAYKMNITKVYYNDNQFLYNEMELYYY